MLPRGKALGGDKLPTEFFQKATQLTTPTIFETFKNIFEANEMPPNLNNEEIVFIPKNDDHSRLAISVPSCNLITCTRFLLKYWCTISNLTSLESLSLIKQELATNLDVKPFV